MGFTYAVKVPTGRELQVKAMIENMLKRFDNPGIIGVQALDTFTQKLSEKGLSARQWKAKVSGYIFVTIANTVGLNMEASCWQFLKRIPLVQKILNQYISHNEWKNFFDNVDDIEPEIQLVEVEREAINIELNEHEHPENNSKGPSLVKLIETVTEIVEEKLEDGKDQVIAVIEKTVAAVRIVVKGRKTMYTIPYKLYKAFVKEDHQEGGGKAKPMSVQSALHQLKTMAKKAVSVCKT